MTTSRTQTITQKIGREKTGLNGSLFAHVDFVARGDIREIVAIRVSEKSKDGSTLDNILAAVSDTLTEIVRQDINKSNVVKIGEGGR